VLVDDRITIATPEGTDVEMVLAGLGSRFLARLLDTFIQAVCIIALLIVGGIAGAVASNGNGGGIALAFVAVGTFGVLWVYDVAFETLASGRTPGKRAAGIRVVGLRGEPVSFRASVVRNVLRIFELALLYLPAVFSILLTEHDQRLGDLAAGTVVVRDSFGGRPNNAVTAWSAITVPATAVATWDVSAITADEVLTVRRFLDRRLALPWHIRSYLGYELVHRLAPRVTGLPDNLHPEYVLEGVVVAKQARA
jgi:uncharacterized RDD family membrane protein YckC